MGGRLSSGSGSCFCGDSAGPAGLIAEISSESEIERFTHFHHHPPPPVFLSIPQSLSMGS